VTADGSRGLKPSGLVGVAWQPGLERPGHLQPPRRG